MSDQLDARPSKNGTGPQPKAGEPGEGAPGPEVTLLVADRLDALERLLGTVRRRGMSLRIHSLARKDESARQTTTRRPRQSRRVRRERRRRRAGSAGKRDAPAGRRQRPPDLRG